MNKLGQKLTAVPTATALLSMIYLFAGFFMFYQFWYYLNGKVADNVSPEEAVALGKEYTYFKLTDHGFDEANIDCYHRVVRTKDSKYYSGYFACPLMDMKQGKRLSTVWFARSYRAGPGNWTRESNLKRFRKIISVTYSYNTRYEYIGHFLVAAKETAVEKIPDGSIFIYGVDSPEDEKRDPLNN